MYKSCRHNALRADMLVRPYGWFANIHGASGYGCTLTILFQQPHITTLGLQLFQQPPSSILFVIYFRRFLFTLYNQGEQHD